MAKSYDLSLSHTDIKTFKSYVIKTKHMNKDHQVLKHINNVNQLDIGLINPIFYKIINANISSKNF